MKSNRGVTLTSLIIYIIVLILVIGIMNNFLNYFNKNVNEITIKESSNEQYARFMSYFTKDINSEDLVFIKTGDEESKEYIIFKLKGNLEHQYIYANNCIYYINKEENNDKKILLCKNVSADLNNAFKYNSGLVEINFKIKDEKFSSTLSVTV